MRKAYGPVASLFRAASKAEEIHAGNHAAVIRKLGAEPKADIQAPEVKSTQENLKAAIAGETYEFETMYPEFIAEAKAEKNSDALRTFNFAVKTEVEHARLYTEALNKLATLKGGAKQYFVCKVCGYTVESLNFLRCLVCGVDKEEYISRELNLPAEIGRTSFAWQDCELTGASEGLSGALGQRLPAVLNFLRGLWPPL